MLPFDRATIKANKWNLTPGRYVGNASGEEDEDFDFERRFAQSTRLDLQDQLSKQYADYCPACDKSV